MDQHILRRDASAVARCIETIVAVEHPIERPDWSPAFRERYDRFYEEGMAKGINFSLSVAIELARPMATSARGADERGMAGNLLGIALQTLGDRESGTARLEEAVAAYHAALTERTRDRVPLQWAETQNNLGLAVRALGERDSGTARLEAAVAAFRAGLAEYTRDRVPLDWAMSTGNQGVALMVLAERLGDSSKARAAVERIEVALATMREGGHAPLRSYYEAQLPRARALLDRLAGG